MNLRVNDLPGTSGYLKHPPVPDPVRVHTAMATALNGWQITLIGVGAALLAVAISLLVLRRPQGFGSAEPRDESPVVFENGRNRGGRDHRGDAAPGSHPGRAEVL